MDKHTFSVTKRIFKGYWIGASDEYLNSLEEFPKNQNPNAKWIWPQSYVRDHIRYTFQTSNNISKATLEINSDNIIDVFLNGHQVAFESKQSGVIDVSESIKVGENRLAVRAYQSATPLYYTAAMRGGIKVLYKNGDVEYFDTDDTWKVYEVCDFGQGEEPDDWTISDNPTYPTRTEKPMVCSNIHHRLMRRSCYFRKEIKISKPIKTATLFSTARGLYECYINGAKTDDSILSPGVKETVIEYQENDVTDLLSNGNNTLAVILGNGWYNCMSWGELLCNKPMFLCDLVVEYTDGSTETISTDNTWLAKISPIYENDIQFGERYDARIDTDNWNKNDCDVSDWTKVTCEKANSNKLIKQKYPPIKRHEELKPVLSRYINDKCKIFKFETNQAARAMVKIKGAKKGDILKIRHCERLINDEPCIGVYIDVFYRQDGLPGGKSPWNIRNTDVYICNDNPIQEYAARFTYTGAAFVYIESDDIDLENVEVSLSVIHSEIEKVGNIKTEHKLIKTLWEFTERTFLSNMISGPTDCPSREKNYWNGDIQIFSDSALWYGDCFEMLAVWSKFGRKLEYDVYGWEDEEYILPLKLYKFYGDIEVVKSKYQRTLELYNERRERFNGILPFGMRSPYRDHLAFDNGMSQDFFACAYYVFSLRKTAKVAELCEDYEQRDRFMSLYNEAKEEFNSYYYNSEEADYGQNCQGGVILPIMLDICDESEKVRLIDTLLKYIKKADYHLTTGFITTVKLLPLLCDYGYFDVAWRIFNQKTLPSWQAMIDTGVTTITESWNGMDENDIGQSLNHFTLGSVCQWFFEYLGGMKPLKPGFEEIQIKPYFNKEIGEFEASYNSVNGLVSTHWKYNGDKVELNIVTPTKTTIILNDEKKVVEAGKYTFII